MRWPASPFARSVLIGEADSHYRDILWGMSSAAGSDADKSLLSPIAGTVVVKSLADPHMAEPGAGAIAHPEFPEELGGNLCRRRMIIYCPFGGMLATTWVQSSRPC